MAAGAKGPMKRRLLRTWSLLLFLADFDFDFRFAESTTSGASSSSTCSDSKQTSACQMTF